VFVGVTVGVDVGRGMYVCVGVGDDVADGRGGSELRLSCVRIRRCNGNLGVSGTAMEVAVEDGSAVGVGVEVGGLVDVGVADGGAVEDGIAEGDGVMVTTVGVVVVMKAKRPPALILLPIDETSMTRDTRPTTTAAAPSL
jgi:hypothetical protein